MPRKWRVDIGKIGFVVLSGETTPLAQLVSASSAVPGLLAPQKINGTWYVDGGVRSGTSVDFGPHAENLVVIAPLAGAMWGPFARFVDKGMHKEIVQWKKRTGGKVLVFSPHNSAASIARNPVHLFDKARAIEAFHLGHEEAVTFNLTFS